MQIADRDIVRFQALYKEHFGIEISKADALERGTKLLRLMSIVYQPMTQEERDHIMERRKEALHIPTE